MDSNTTPEELLHLWGIEGASVQLIRESDNQVFLAERSDGLKRILRIGKKRFPEDIDFELSALKGLSDNGILVPKLWPTLRGTWSASAGAQGSAVLFEFLEGVHPKTSGTSLDKASPPSITMIEEAGKALAELHLVTEKLCSAMPLESVRTVYSELEALQARKKDFLGFTAGAETFLNDFEKLSDTVAAMTLPSGIIHNDFRPHNLLFNAEDRMSGILDFDWSCRGPLIKDLALAAVEWSFADGADAPFTGYFETFIRAYEKVRPLTSAERSHFPLMVEFTLYSEAATFYRICLQYQFEWGKKVTSSYMYRKAIYFSRLLQKKAA